MSNEIKVGTAVSFKNDIEAIGTVVKVNGRFVTIEYRDCNTGEKLYYEESINRVTKED